MISNRKFIHFSNHSIVQFWWEFIDFSRRCIKSNYAHSSLEHNLVNMSNVSHRQPTIEFSYIWATITAVTKPASQSLNKCFRIASTILISQWQSSSCIILHLNATQHRWCCVWIWMCVRMCASDLNCVWACVCVSNVGPVSSSRCIKFSTDAYRIGHYVALGLWLANDFPIVIDDDDAVANFCRLRAFSLPLFNLAWQISKLKIIIDRCGGGGASALRKSKMALRVYECVLLLIFSICIRA